MICILLFIYVGAPENDTYSRREYKERCGHDMTDYSLSNAGLFACSYVSGPAAAYIFTLLREKFMCGSNAPI